MTLKLPTTTTQLRGLLVLLLSLAGLAGVTPAAAQTMAIGKAADFSREKMAQMWEDETQGRNLAAGLEVSFASSPDYHLTLKGGTDTKDLTDGALSPKPDQQIWWDANAVGWGSAGTKKIIIDFGKPETVSHVVWRVVAGSHLRGFTGPKEVRVYGSLDGETAYQIGERHRWAEDNARPDSYRLPNIGLPSTGDEVYVYPLRLEVQNYQLRYLILQFNQDSVWFCTDELAVIEGTGTGKALSALKPEQLQTKDAWITFDDAEVPVAADVKLPLWFRQTDLRLGGATMPLSYEFEVPEGVTLDVPTTLYATEQTGNRVTVRGGRGGNSTEVGPFFLTTSEGFSADQALRFRAVADGAAPQPWHELALVATAFPPPFTLQYLTTGIGWMIDRERDLWPEFAANYRRIGFNTVPSFPRAWEPTALANGVTLDALAQAADPTTLTEEGRRFAKLRAQGFKTVYMESPLHVVNWMYPDGAKEYRCDSGPVTGINSFCPSYRGKYFADELDRLRRCYLMMGGADYVILDCELLGSSQWLSPGCTRCDAARAAKGMTLDDLTPFLQGQVTDLLGDMNAALKGVAADRGWKTPPIGMYAVDTTELYSGLLTYPCDGLFDFQNTSLYTGDYPEQIHTVIRNARSKTDANNIIPWLSTNTGGRVSPTNARIMVWEALVNGSIGLTYFTFSDLTPAHYLEIARALSQIAPVEEIVYRGTPAWSEFKVTAGTARLSATRLDASAVLLLANPTAEAQTITWQHESGLTGSDTIPAGDAILKKVDLR